MKVVENRMVKEELLMVKMLHWEHCHIKLPLEWLSTEQLYIVVVLFYQNIMF